MDISFLRLPSHILLPRFRVCLMGESQVGKTALVSQFQTSDFLNTYDASLGNQRKLNFPSQAAVVCVVVCTI